MESSGSNHHQHHLEPTHRLQRVRFVGGHNDEFSRTDRMSFARNRDLRLPLQNLYQRIKRRRVLAQPLTLIKRKHRHRTRFCFQDHAADDGIRLIIDQIDNSVRERPEFANGLEFLITFHVTPPSSAQCYSPCQPSANSPPATSSSSPFALPETNLKNVLDANLFVLQTSRYEN